MRDDVAPEVVPRVGYARREPRLRTSTFSIRQVDISLCALERQMDQRTDDERERHEGLLDRGQYTFVPTPSNSDLMRRIEELEKRVESLENGNRSR